MHIALWVIAAGLAFVFLVGGSVKLIRPKEKLTTDPTMAWAEDFSPGMIKSIGLLEVLASAGLVLPALLDIAPVLVPLAALGLVLVMIGAIVVHLRLKEGQAAIKNVVLLVLAAVVVWGRFGPYAF